MVTDANDPEQVRRAFEAAAAGHDVTSRSAPLTVQAPKVTQFELRVIKEALCNPPDKVDWPSAGISLLSAVFFAGKTLHESVADGKIGLVPMGVVCLCVALIAAQCVRVAGQLRKKAPALQSIALEHLEELITGKAAGVVTVAKAPMTAGAVPPASGQQALPASSQQALPVSGQEALPAQAQPTPVPVGSEKR